MLSAITGGVGLSSSGAASSNPSASKSPILIGYNFAETGPFAATQAGAIEYFSAYIDYINNTGGIDGHKIDLTVLDDKGDPGQSLLNVEAMWSQDKVVAIYDADTFIPFSYIHDNQVPAFGCSQPRCFASYYPTIFPLSSISPSWAAQIAYWQVKVLHHQIKIVEVQYNPAYVAYNPWIQSWWTKLGATQVYFDPDGGPSADCTAFVLKMQSENVQFYDPEGSQFINCVEAEARLNWHPSIAQGSGSTSPASLALLVGAPIVGTIAGAVATAANGSPIYPHPTLFDRTYVGNIKTYAPQWARPIFLNGGNTVGQYGYAVTMVHYLKGTLEKYGKITPALLVKYTQSQKYYDNGLQPPNRGMSPNCKTGFDGTTWGIWRSDGQGSYTHFPQTSGNQWMTTLWVGGGKCYQTNLANQFYPNG